MELKEGYEVFVIADATGTFNEITRDFAWDRMSNIGAQMIGWFAAACELHRDWCNDIIGLGTLFSNHIPDYRNLMISYDVLTTKNKAFLLILFTVSLHGVHDLSGINKTRWLLIDQGARKCGVSGYSNRANHVMWCKIK